MNTLDDRTTTTVRERIRGTARTECAAALNDFAIAARKHGYYHRAFRYYNQALCMDADNVGIRFNLARTLAAEGAFEQAYTHYVKVATDSATLAATALYHATMLKRIEPSDPVFLALQALVHAGDSVVADQPFIHFALAKALDDMGCYDDAFGHFAVGNRLYRARVAYDETLTRTLFASMPGRFSQDVPVAPIRRAAESPRLIFILGMPCSGSSLVEQMLAGHPDVRALGELSALPDAANATVYSRSSGLDTHALAQLRRLYLRSIPPARHAQQQMTDKQFTNIFNVGLVALAFPTARIVHTVRDPMATCFSCYTRLFENVPYSYAFEELAHYYGWYTELMAFWQRAFDGRAFLNVSYERVIAEPTEELRRLFDYCELRWDKRSTPFHKVRRPVATNSAFQVRQPLSSHSMARWRHYQTYLGPLSTALAAALGRPVCCSDSSTL
jgi:hypothetical protein